MATETLVSSPSKSVMFMSRRSELRLVKKPQQPVFGPGGSQVRIEAGETLAFKDGRLDVPTDRPVSLEAGETAAPDEVLEFLRGHKFLDDLYDGFWEVDPVVPAPSEDEMSTLIAIAQAHDVQKLEAYLEQETAGYARPVLVQAATNALEQARETRAKIAERQKAKAENAPAAPTEAQTTEPEKTD